MKRVYSVTINGANDCVCMTESEASFVTLKFAEKLKMYDMTARHGMKPEHLHKLQRYEDALLPHNCVRVGAKPIYTKGIGPGQFGGSAQVMWEFQDLMEMKNMTKYTQQIEQDGVKAALINGIIEVAFTKADGSLRKMNATLLESVVPKANKEDPLSTKAVRKVSPEVCVIWDVDANCWKSFRWDRLKTVEEKT